VHAEDDARWLDGNAIAGLLWELLGAEVTAAPRGCQSCKAVNAIGAHRLYRGAGLVLRCPNCGDVALRLVEQRGSYAVDMRGAWQLELPA
jgi:predicted RNA-binding Zn-ribbon protein involved in translation (DUF1610 family)